MEVLLSVCLGIALSAACGFRIFVPLLIASLAGHFGVIDLTGNWAWLASWPAIITFMVATLAEITAYYISFLDNLLDTAAFPVATAAGTLLTASQLTEVDPMLQWTLAAIAGGGAAASMQLATTKARALSSATTAGLGNPLLATAEVAGSTFLSGLALFFPILAAVGAVTLLVVFFVISAVIIKKVVAVFTPAKDPRIIDVRPDPR